MEKKTRFQEEEKGLKQGEVGIGLQEESNRTLILTCVVYVQKCLTTRTRAAYRSRRS